MANHIAGVAKLLGVEVGEVFFIKEYPSDSKMYLKFTENGLERSLDKDSWAKAAGWVWELIITGALKINKLPWKPREGEKYYVPCIAVRPGDRHYHYYWNNDDINIEHYRMGLVCKTIEEAIALTEKMLAVAKEAMLSNWKNTQVCKNM